MDTLTTSKHTPGPWYVASTGNHQALIVSERNGDNIAVVYDGEANSAVLAAAPDLLAALKRIVEDARTRDSGDGAIFGADYVTDALDAIAKAEGGRS